MGPWRGQPLPYAQPNRLVFITESAKMFPRANLSRYESVSLDGNAYTIIGVLPREFAFVPRANVQFWVPLLDRNGCEIRRSCHNFDGVQPLGNLLHRNPADLAQLPEPPVLRWNHRPRLVKRPEILLDLHVRQIT